MMDPREIKPSDVVKFITPEKINWKATENAIKEIVVERNPDLAPGDVNITVKILAGSLKRFANTLGVKVIYHTILFIKGKVEFVK